MKKGIGRRIAAFVLCLAMCLQSVSLDAFAEEISEPLPTLSEESPKEEDVLAVETQEETTDDTEVDAQEEASENEIEADSVYYTRAINHALAKAEGLGDLQKIVFFHDYLATNCLRSKDTSLNTAEHALVEQKANAEGYALAYQALLTAAGIECYVAKSSSLGKAWNIVKYNGYYYNVDVWTDDYYPVGNVNHNFMMCSDTIFSDYQGSDKIVTKDGTTYSISCNNNVYDNYYWRKAVSPIVMDSEYRDECYYIEYTDNYDNALKRGNFINSASFFSLKESTASSSAIDIWHGNGMTYGEKGIFSGLFEKDGWIYYNTTNSICCVQYNAKGDGAIYTFSLDSGNSIYGMDLYYDVKNDREVVRYIVASGGYRGVDPYGTLIEMNNFDFTKRPSGGGGGTVDPDPDPDPTSLSAPVISITGDSTGSHVVLDNGTVVFDFGTTLVVKFTQAENATVYYTKNGSEPTTSSTAGNIINVYNTCTIKAKAIQGNISSETTTMKFERASNTFTISSTLSLSKGAQGTITVSALPTSKTAADITWSSSDTQVATVDTNGKVTGVAGGTATITAATTTYKGEAVTATCKVTVSDNTKYTVTFTGLNGKVLKTQEVTAGGNATPPTNTSETGYTFDSWVGNYTNVQKNETVTAKYNPVSYTITYNLNGGTDPGNATSYTIETATITLKNPTKAGYEFGGWYTSSACTGTAVTTIAKGSTGNKTFYAKWDPVSYTITYNLNGGTDPGNVTSYTAETATITLKNPTKAGYIFTGWYENASCSGVAVTQIVKGSTGNKTFYAGWDANPVEYTVTFYAKDGVTKLGTPQKVFAGKSATAPTPPEVKGYTFDKWSVAFTNVQSDLSVVAQYKPTNYKITYNLNGGTYAGDNPNSYTIESETITLKNASGKTGYRFLGWYATEDFSGNQVTEIKKGSTGNVTLYAKWEEIFYTVKFVGFNGVLIEEVQVKEGYAAQAPAIPDIAGYKSAGWDGSYTNVTADLTITAKYNIIHYTINYVTNGGAGNGGNPTSYNIESMISLKPAGDKTGYAFAGWYDNAACTGNPVTEIAAGNTGNKTLYAKWKIQKELWLKWKNLAEDQELSTPYTGSAIKPEFDVYMGKTLLTAGVDYTFAYKNNVNANLLSTDAEKKKAPVVIITGKGNYAGKVEMTFKITPKSLNDTNDIKYAVPALTYNGKVQKAVPTVVWGTKKLANKKDFDLVYPQESAGSYAEPGKYTLQIVGKGNYTGTIYASQIIVDEKKNTTTLNINKAKATAIPAFTYSGSAVSLESVSLPVVKYGNEVLVCGTDYTLDYNRSAKEIGTYPVIIRGTGKYYGEMYTTFQIKGIAASGLKVFDATTQKTSITQQKYTGKEVKPAILVKDAKGNTLTNGVDYTISYSNNINAGNGQILITGKGHYTGVKKVSFSIKPLEMDANRSSFTVSYASGSATHSYVKGGVKPKLIVKYGNDVLVEGKDYSLSYKNNTAISDNPAKKPTIIVTGKKNFAKSFTVEFSIKKASLSQVTMTAADMVYNATPGKFMSKPVLTDVDGKKLAQGKDYKDIEYYDINGNKMDKTSKPAVGNVIRIKVYGMGNYEGTKEVTYRIFAKGYSIASAKVTILNKKYYDGEPVTLSKDDLKVEMGKVVLSADDYEIVSYSNNVSKGNAKVTIRGVGKYAGTKTFSLPIASKQLVWWSK